MFQQGRIFTSSPASQPDDTYNLIIILVPGLSCGSENFLQRNWAERDWRRRFRNEAGQREARLTATWYFQKRKWVRISSEMKGLTQTVWTPGGGHGSELSKVLNSILDPGTEHHMLQRACFRRSENLWEFLSEQTSGICSINILISFFVLFYTNMIKWLFIYAVRVF